MKKEVKSIYIFSDGSLTTKITYGGKKEYHTGIGAVGFDAKTGERVFELSQKEITDNKRIITLIEEEAALLGIAKAQEKGYESIVLFVDCIRVPSVLNNRFQKLISLGQFKAIKINRRFNKAADKLAATHNLSNNTTRLIGSKRSSKQCLWCGYKE